MVLLFVVSLLINCPVLAAGSIGNLALIILVGFGGGTDLSSFVRSCARLTERQHPHQGSVLTLPMHCPSARLFFPSAHRNYLHENTEG